MSQAGALDSASRQRLDRTCRREIVQCRQEQQRLRQCHGFFRMLRNHYIRRVYCGASCHDSRSACGAQHSGWAFLRE